MRNEQALRAASEATIIGALRFALLASLRALSSIQQQHTHNTISTRSGLPALTPSLLQSQRYFREAEGFTTLLGYKQMNAGGCKVLCHPDFGSKFYPGTIMCFASLNAIKGAIAEVFQ